MYTTIHSYDEQEFDMSVESEKETLSFGNRGGLFQVKVRLSKPK